MGQEEKREFEGFSIRLIQGDITKQQAGAIANAANSQLAGGGGVDGAIHKAGGPEIMRELQRHHGCPTGQAVATNAGDLSATHVYHAVGPVYQGGNKNEEELLASAYRSCLELAVKHKISSIAFPSISTGVYGYPVGEAAKVALRTIVSFLSENKGPGDIRFVLFDDETFSAYREALAQV